MRYSLKSFLAFVTLLAVLISLSASFGLFAFVLSMLPVGFALIYYGWRREYHIYSLTGWFLVIVSIVVSLTVDAVRNPVGIGNARVSVLIAMDSKSRDENAELDILFPNGSTSSKTDLKAGSAAFTCDMKMIVRGNRKWVSGDGLLIRIYRSNAGVVTVPLLTGPVELVGGPPYIVTRQIALPTTR